MHTAAPGSNASTGTKDSTIPSWADDEFIWDPIPEAVWDSRPLKKSDRMHLLVLHDSILVTDAAIPESEFEALLKPVKDGNDETEEDSDGGEEGQNRPSTTTDAK